MRRLLSLWLTLLGAYWLTRAGASALLWGRVDGGFPAALELAVVPALQALALGWATRAREDREGGTDRGGGGVEENRRTRQAGADGAGAAGTAGEAKAAEGGGSG